MSNVMNFWGVPGLYGNLGNNFSHIPYKNNNAIPSKPPVYMPNLGNNWNNPNLWLSGIGTALGVGGTIAGLISRDTNAYEDRKFAKQRYNDNLALRDKREKERDDFNDYIKNNWKSVWDRS